MALNRYLPVYLLVILLILSSFFITFTSNAIPSRANTLPVPVIEVSEPAVLTLENLTIDASNSYDPDGAIAFYKFHGNRLGKNARGGACLLERTVL